MLGLIPLIMSRLMTLKLYFSLWNILYSVYTWIFFAMKVSRDSPQTPPCLVGAAWPWGDLRPLRCRSWRPGRGCRCRSLRGQGRPGARTASCLARTRCSSGPERARPRPGTRGTRRSRAAAAAIWKIMSDIKRSTEKILFLAILTFLFSKAASSFKIYTFLPE